MKKGAWFIVAGATIACGTRFTSATGGDAGPAVSEGGASGASGAPGSSGTSGTSGSVGVSGSSSGGGGRVSGRGGSSGSASGGASGSSSNGGSSAGADSGGAPSNAGGGSGSPAAGGSSSGGTIGATGGTIGSTADASVCPNDDPKCSDGTCSRLAWNFESGSLDGVTAVDSSGQPLDVRSFDGTMALAVDVSQLNAIPGISFTLALCESGAVGVQSRTLSFRVFFEGGPASSFDFYVQTALPDPRSGAYLDQIGAGTGTWIDYSSPLSKSTFSGSATTVTIQAGSLGGAFTGTIWFDDFRIH
jgi:hypothetical protein